MGWQPSWSIWSWAGLAGGQLSCHIWTFLMNFCYFCNWWEESLSQSQESYSVGNICRYIFENNSRNNLRKSEVRWYWCWVGEWYFGKGGYGEDGHFWWRWLKRLNGSWCWFLFEFSGCWETRWCQCFNWRRSWQSTRRECCHKLLQSFGTESEIANRRAHLTQKSWEANPNQ